MLVTLAEALTFNSNLQPSKFPQSWPPLVGLTCPVCVFSSADLHRSHEEQGSSVHHRQRRGERPSADARLSQGRPHRAAHPPELRPGPGFLRASLKTKNLWSALLPHHHHRYRRETGPYRSGGEEPSNTISVFIPLRKRKEDRIISDEHLKLIRLFWALWEEKKTTQKRTDLWYQCADISIHKGRSLNLLILNIWANIEYCED